MLLPDEPLTTVNPKTAQTVESIVKVAKGEDGWVVANGNCQFLSKFLPPSCVDLLYADIPYNTGRSFGDDYDDRWAWHHGSDEVYRAASEKVRKVVDAACIVHGDSMGAYLLEIGSMLSANGACAVPLPSLKPTASLWVQCDTVAAPYLRLLLDALFGVERWRNSVVWRYRRWPTTAKRLQRMHDVLHFYAGDGATWNPMHGVEELAESTKRAFGAKKQKALFEDGRRVRSTVEPEPSPGPPLSDVWDTGEWALGEMPDSVWELPVLAAQAKEREDGGKYPTQKPKALLQRVVGCSGTPGGLLLDVCCGSGTSLVAGREKGMRVIGFDRNPRAVEISRRRLDQVSQTFSVGSL